MTVTSSETETDATDADADDTLEWLVLEPDEKLRWQAGPRIQTVYPWLALALVGSLVAVAAVALEVLSLLGLLWIPVFVAPAAWQYAQVTRTAYVVTTNRVAVKRGVLGRTVRVVGLERIQNTRRSQHALGRAADYGTVTIETAGGSDLQFQTVDDPDAIQARLDRNRSRVRDDRPTDRVRHATDVPGSRDQWTAVLEEVRGWRRTLERSKSN